jgi:hypothetical protein
VHKILKEKHDYTIITWKELHQYLMDELATQELLEIVFVKQQFIPISCWNSAALFSKT